MSKPEKENGRYLEWGGELRKKSYIFLLDLLRMHIDVFRQEHVYGADCLEYYTISEEKSGVWNVCCLLFIV